MNSAPEHLVLELGRLRVAALAWGPESGRLALCLHGYPDTAWTWRTLGPALAARGYRVVAPFSRGYAPTALPADGSYHVGALMDDAIQLHKLLGGGTDAILIGHDWGGLTAGALAAYPDCPFGTIVSMGVPLMAGAKCGDSGQARLLAATPAQLRMSWYILFQQIPRLAERFLDRVISRLWRDWTPNGYDSTADLAYVEQALSDPRARTAAVSYYRMNFRPWGIPERYRELHMYWRHGAPLLPMLMVHGQQDGAVDERVAAHSAHALPPGSRYAVIADAGHFVQLDRPAEVLTAIDDYVRA